MLPFSQALSLAATTGSALSVKTEGIMAPAA